MALLRCLVQRCIANLSCGVDRCTLFQQELDHVDLTEMTSGVKWSVSSLQHAKKIIHLTEPSNYDYADVTK